MTFSYVLGSLMTGVSMALFWGIIGFALFGAHAWAPAWAPAVLGVVAGSVGATVFDWHYRDVMRGKR